MFRTTRPAASGERRVGVRLVLWLAAAGFLAALVVGHDVHERLTPGGTLVRGSESERAGELLQGAFRAGTPHLVLIAHAPGPVDDPRVAAAGAALTARLAKTPGVVHATSYWATRSPSLRSRDGRAGLVLARLRGNDTERLGTARRIVPGLTGAQGPLTVTATGEAQVGVEAQERSARDLRNAEILAAPLVLAILLVVFGSLTAAVLPVLVGALAVAGTAAVLRLLTSFTEVSVFAMSVASALGFALAVDFSLFVITRFREELGHGRDARTAVGVTLRTTGRAMAYSAATVTLCLAALLLFPLAVFRSIAYGGIAVTVLAALGSLVVLPAVLLLLGERIDRLTVYRPRRRTGLWSRVATGVTRRPLRVAVPTALLLTALGLPFLDVRFGVFDDRLLPPQASAAQAAQELRRDFDVRDTITATTLVLPGLRATDPRSGAGLSDYARRVSTQPGVVRVDTATGSYAHGRRLPTPPDAGARFTGPAGSWLAVSTAHEPYSVDNSELAQRLRRIPAPERVLVGGPGAQLADIRQGIADALPLALALIALTTFCLVVALTGGLLLGLKALLMNTLSLGATFGVLVHIFQEGHLRWLVGDFTVTGSTDVTVPVLLFCIAFGVSMDYEIFLLSRITEDYRRTGDTAAAVVSGLRHTGRLFTSAAVIVAVVMGALTTSGLTLLKMIGVGLAVAVLLDCTLVRGLLVPAVMRLAGPANWWSPRLRTRSPATAPHPPAAHPSRSLR
ncbi:MAG TPA: MMPL family transporter [Thermomonospora sp.]|nr:MMPL family transporter [Thermomonospora sp.]